MFFAIFAFNFRNSLNKLKIFQFLAHISGKLNEKKWCRQLTAFSLQFPHIGCFTEPSGRWPVITSFCCFFVVDAVLCCFDLFLTDSITRPPSDDRPVPPFSTFLRCRRLRVVSSAFCPSSSSSASCSVLFSIWRDVSGIDNSSPWLPLNWCCWWWWLLPPPVEEGVAPVLFVPLKVRQLPTLSMPISSYTSS